MAWVETSSERWGKRLAGFPTSELASVRLLSFVHWAQSIGSCVSALQGQFRLRSLPGAWTPWWSCFLRLSGASNHWWRSLLVESLKGRFGKLRETMATSFCCSHSFRMGVGHLNTKRGLCIDISQPALTVLQNHPRNLLKISQRAPPQHTLIQEVPALGIDI